MKLITDPGQRPKIPYTLSYYSHWLFMMKLITDPGQRPKIPYSLSYYSHWLFMMMMVIMMMMMILSIFAGDKNFITEWEMGCD